MRIGWIAVVTLAVAWMMTPSLVSAQGDQTPAAQTVAPQGEVAPAAPTAISVPEPTYKPSTDVYTPSPGAGALSRQKGEDVLPLKFSLHGYYRARYNWIQNVPLSTLPGASKQQSLDTAFGYMRLRLEPEVTYGPNPDLPIAKLQVTVDGFDNVVFGDNARVFNVPLFAVDQSLTTIDGTDLRDSLKLERAWIEFLVPVGLMRVGRMESHWGMGLLTHAGNDLAEWGDFLRGETFDRILFATRPITVYKGISKGDTRKTPLIYALVYDRLSQDPVTDSTMASTAPPAAAGSAVASDYQFRPFFTTFPERPTHPHE